MKDNKKYGAYQYGAQKTKKKSSKAVTIVIVVLLLLSLSAGAAGIYREDIKGLFNKSEPVTPVDPDPTTPVIPDEPVTPVDPDPTTPVIPDEPETPVNPEPSIVRLAAGSSPDSIYIDTDNFETAVKAHIADLDIDQSPDYMGIGYKFLTVPVMVDEITADIEFAIVPFVRLFDNLGLELPENISADDFFLMIYAPNLNDWVFNNVFYSTVSADFVFDLEDGSINLTFYKGFRSIAFDDFGKVKVTDIIAREVSNRYDDTYDYSIGNLENVDTVITPVAFAAEPLKSPVEKTTLTEGDNVTNLYFNYVNFQDILSSKDSYIKNNLINYRVPSDVNHSYEICVAKFRVASTDIDNDNSIIPLLFLPVANIVDYALAGNGIAFTAESGLNVDFCSPISLVSGNEDAYLMCMTKGGVWFYYCSENLVFDCFDTTGSATQFSLCNFLFDNNSYFNIDGKINWQKTFVGEQCNLGFVTSVTIENLYHQDLFNLLFSR